MVFVACLENELSLVFPFQALLIDVIGLWVQACRLLVPVLHHDGIDFLLGAYYLQLLIFDRHGELLVTAVHVDVGVGGHGETDIHHGLHHIEIHFSHGFMTGILVVDGEAIVATHADAALLVGNTESVVGIADGGVERVLIVVDRVVVEPLQPVALENVG